MHNFTAACGSGQLPNIAITFASGKSYRANTINATMVLWRRARPLNLVQLEAQEDNAAPSLALSSRNTMEKLTCKSTKFGERYYALIFCGFLSNNSGRRLLIMQVHRFGVVSLAT